MVAPGRSSRPGAQGRTTRIADAATCPFCEGHEAMTPPEVLAQFAPQALLRLPMRPGNRSLNLSNAVAVAVFEAWRQLGYRGSE